MSRKTRKLMWSVPLIAAVAVIGALAAVRDAGTRRTRPRLRTLEDSVSTAPPAAWPGDGSTPYDPLHRGRRPDVPAGDVERAHPGR